MAKYAALILVAAILLAQLAFCDSGEIQIGSQTINLAEQAGNVSGAASLDVHDYAIKTAAILSDAQVQALEAQGVRVNDYVGGTTYLARSSSFQMEQAKSSGTIQAYYLLGISHKAPESLTSTQKKQLSVLIVPYSAADVPFLVSKLANMGARASAVSQTAVIATIDSAKLGTLLSFKEVKWAEENLPRSISNNYAQALTGVSDAKEKSLAGLGQVISVADTGLDTGDLQTLHLDLRNRTYAIFALGREGNASDTHGHGTHVAGTLVGTGYDSGGSITGFAPNAGIYFQSVMDYDGGLGGIPLDIYDLFNQTYVQGARIFSSSWGSQAMGAYTFDSQSADRFAYDNPDALLVFAAGNDGTAGSVNSPCTAKNAICAGASENARPGYDPQKIAPYSSRGPAADGRVKPDFVAPGSMLLSTKSSLSSATFWGSYDQYYVFNGGTSMATPALAGTAAVLREYITANSNLTSPSSAIMRAALGALADKIGSAPKYSPDADQGWGKPNLKDIVSGTKAIQIYRARPGGLAIGQADEYGITIGTASQLSVALAWTDVPASTLANSTLVNDLDLLVTDSQGVKYYPNGKAAPDRINTMEKTIIPNAQGNYTITVTYANGSDASSQYGLAVVADSFDARGQGVLEFSPRPYYVGQYGNRIAVLSKQANLTSLGNATLVFVAGSGANCSFGSAVMTSPQTKPVQPSGGCRMLGPYYECNFEGLENGQYFADVQCARGNASAAFGTGFAVFNGAPNYTISAQSGGFVNYPEANFSAASGDSMLKCAFGTSQELRVLPAMGMEAGVWLGGGEGGKTVFAQCQDEYGNLGQVLNSTVVLDMTAPQVQAGMQNGIAKTLPHRVSINASAQDNFGLASCTATEQYPNATPYLFFSSGPGNATVNASFSFDMDLLGASGNDSVAVSCSDFAGNAAQPQSVNFTFDNSTPAITSFAFEGGQVALQPGESITLMINSANATYCRMKFDSDVSNDTYPANGQYDYTLPESQSGVHEASALCFGENGRSAESKALGIVIDNTPPNVTVLSPTGGLYQSAPEIEFDASDDYSDALSCQVSADYGTSASLAVYGKKPASASLGTANSGAHGGTISCTDAAGNAGSANFSFSANPLAPGISLRAASKYAGGDSAIISIGLGQGASLERIEVDGAESGAGNSTGNATISGLGTGYHNVSAFVQTPFGEVVQSIFIYSDASVPQIAQLDAPVAWPDSRLQISANATPYSAITVVSANGSAYSGRTGPLGVAHFNITLANPGKNAFAINIASATGVNGTSSNFTVEYNTTVPSDPVFAGVPNITRQQSVQFNITSANATGMKFWSDKYPNKTAVQGNGTFPAVLQLAEGNNAIYAQGFSAKNISSNITSVNATRDSTGPAISLASPQAGGYTNEKRPEIRISAQDAHSGCDMGGSWLEINGIRVNASANQSACSLEYSPQSDLSEGYFEVTANASDSLNNTARAVFNFTTIFTPPRQPNVTLSFNSTHAILNWSGDNQSSIMKYDIYYSLDPIIGLEGKAPIATLGAGQASFAKALGNDGPDIHFAIIAYDLAGNPSQFESEISGTSPIYVAPEPVGYSTPSKLKIDTVTEKTRKQFGSGEITITRTFSSTDSSTTAVFVVENTGTISFSNIVFSISVPSSYASAAGGLRYLTEPETAQVTSAGALPAWTISTLLPGDKFETGMLLTPKLSDTKLLSEDIAIKQAASTDITPSKPAESGQTQQGSQGQAYQNPAQSGTSTGTGQASSGQGGTTGQQSGPQSAQGGKINVDLTVPIVEARQVISIANYVPVLLLGALLSALLVWTVYNRVFPEDYTKGKDPFAFEDED
ncbi:MAG: S8 family serine peptidase [Candidatus Micrarchaeia archaeon]